MTELCQIYNISRKTGYKWIERFQESGPSGLEELDRRPQNCPHVTPDRVVKEILELRFKHPTWLKLGIVHERIEPGEPQQNGRHEPNAPHAKKRDGHATRLHVEGTTGPF